MPDTVWVRVACQQLRLFNASCVPQGKSGAGRTESPDNATAGAFEAQVAANEEAFAVWSKSRSRKVK